MLKAKVADTPHAVAQGLMFVKDLPEDEGMLFVFAKSGKLSFWGMNTFIPLDVAFVDSNNVIKKISHIKPFALNPVSCDDKCIMAIEANSGYFEGNEIAVGDSIDIDRGSFIDDAHITFSKTSKESSFNQGKIKQSQLSGAQPLAVPPAQPVVSKPGADVGGQPIQNNPTEQEMPEQNLPVIDPSNMDEYLEDAFDEESQQIQDGLDGHLDQPDEPDKEDKDTEGYPVFSNVFEAADWAEQNLEVVRINYTTKHGRALIRDVEPHGSFHSHSTKKEILVTYDETVNGIRAFIATNIGNWAFVGRQFQKKFVVKA